MGVADFFRPKWRNSDPSIRISAITAGLSDELLMRIVREDSDARVQRAALAHIRDLSGLAHAVTRWPSAEIRSCALDRIDDGGILTSIARNDGAPGVRRKAMERLVATQSGSEVFFAERAVTDRDPTIRRLAVDQLHSASALTDVAGKSADPAVLATIVSRLSAERTLADLAVELRDGAARLAAVAKVHDQGLLREVLTRSDDDAVRRRALDGVDDERVCATLAVELRDGAARLAAVAKIRDQGLLREVLTRSEDDAVRRRALDGVDDERVCATLAVELSDASLRLAAFAKVSDPALIYETLERSTDEVVQEVAIAKTHDGETLCAIAEASENPKLRNEALSRIEDASLLARVGRRSVGANTRIRALARVVDDEVLVAAALEDPDERVRRAAGERLRNPASMVEVILRSSDAAVRAAVMRCLTDDACLANLAVKCADDLALGAVRKLVGDGSRAEVAKASTAPAVIRAAVRAISDAGALDALLTEVSGSGRSIETEVLLQLLDRDEENGRAGEWMSRLVSLAEAGDPEAQCGVGIAMLRGGRLTKDVNRGRSLLQAAIEAGSVEALYQLGSVVLDDDVEWALELYERAAINGHPRAQVQLGAILYFAPDERRSDHEAYLWCSLAAGQADPAGGKMLRMLEEEIPVRRLYSARNYARRWRREHGSPIPMIVAQEDRDCGLDACHNPGVTPVHVRLSADMDVVGTFCEEHAPSAEAQYLASRYKRMDLDAGYTIVAPQDPERWEVDALMDPARKAMCAWCYVYPCGDGAALVIEDKTGQQWGLCTACYGEYARRASSRAPR